jgi:RNA polymerase sigma-70 factor (ECF subfamily)
VATSESKPQSTPATESSGDELAELYREYYSRVFGAAYRITGNASDAEDVLQTVFLRLSRREEGLDLGRGAGSYLHRAAVNAALDMIRSRKRARAVDLDSVDEQLTEAEESGPAAQGERGELRRILRRAVASLSPRAAEIFSLRYFEGYGNLEIADMLGTSQTAVAVILHRARHRLRKELQPLLGATS